MRAAIDLEALGTRTIWVDCDVFAGRWGHSNSRDYRRLRRPGISDQKNDRRRQTLEDFP